MRIQLKPALFLAGWIFAGLAGAATITGHTPDWNGSTGYPFGNLDQAITDCGANGCGPAAAVNSFVMLQNLYPGIYDRKLVPYAGEKPTQDEMAEVANKLDDLMDCYMADEHAGTYIENFIYGKWSYLEDKAPKKTIYKAYVGGNLKWRNNPAGSEGYDNGGKPSWVTYGTTSAAWLGAELDHGEDVEIFISNARGSHYLTLSSLSFDTVAKTGTVGFMNSRGGSTGTADITGLDKDGNLLLSYDGGATLYHAVSESPIPEPGTFLLLAIGLTVTVLLRRKVWTTTE